MRKRILIILLIAIGIITKINKTDAQTGNGSLYDQYRLAMDQLFSGLDESKISTGILMEKALQLTAIEKFNGTDTAKAAIAEDWRNSYIQLYTAHLDPNEFYLNTNLLNEYPLKETVDNEIPLGIIFYEYNTFSEEALKNGDIRIDTINNLVSDLSGFGSNPYSLKNCFIATPLIDRVLTGTYTYNITSSLFFSNKTSSFDQISIDFGDGMGYRQVYMGSFQIVNYSTAGLKEINILALKNGIQYIAKANIEVFHIKEDPFKSNETPDLGPLEFADENSGIVAEYAIWYSCNNKVKSIRKPYIIVSGFDPSDKNRFVDEKYKVNLYDVANKDNYLNRLRYDGYDIILYRSKNSMESIISNAQNLEAFIQFVNTEKTSDNELILVGASMGGLVVRYALTHMESQGIDHHTKLFISMDSPQLGANVPLGFQHMFDGMSKVLNDIGFRLINFDDILNKKMLDGDAAKQMLLYHYSKTSGSTAKESDLRTSFVNNLASIGNFPQNCRTIGLSQGSGIGTNQGFNPGALVLQKQPAYLAGGLGVFSNMRLRFDVKSVPDATSAKIFEINVKCQVCTKVWNPFRFKWVIVCAWNPPGFPEVTKSVTVNNTKPYDNAPGSMQGFHNLNALKSDQDLVMDFDMDDLVSYIEDAGYFWHDNNNDCFIPTFSSLALNVNHPYVNAKEFLQTQPNVVKVNDNTYYNFNGDNTSLFDVLYVENINDNHIYNPDTKEGAFSESMLSMMATETSPEDLYLENIEILNGQVKDYEARNTITVGENVDGVPENNGKIIVQSGAELNLSASEAIILKTGFSAQSGSLLSIVPNAPEYCSHVRVRPVKSIENVNVETITKETSSKPKDNVYDLVKEFSKPLVVYPNPVNDNLYISSDKKVNKLRLIDIQGNVLISKNFERKTVLNVSDLKPGIYILEVEQENGENIREKIIKQ